MRFVTFLERNGEKFDVCAKGHEVKRKKAKLSLIYKKPKEEIDEDSFIPTEEIDSSGGNHVITDIACPFCGAKKALYLRSYTFHADEGEIFLMKCLECAKNFRSGSGGACGT